MYIRSYLFIDEGSSQDIWHLADPNNLKQPKNIYFHNICDI